tara:strand:+ start:116 stop:1069 length:954 start_codon:yes stop_codon:yes gene_type:complete
MTDKKTKIGVLLPNWDNGYQSGTPRSVDVLQSARVADQADLDSVWIVDHFLAEPYLDSADYGDVDEADKGRTVGFWECWTLVSAISAATSRIEIGTLVSNTGYRNPALLAQMMNTIDDLSDGRLIAGLGAGDWPAEHAKFGYSYEHRIGRFEEALNIIKPLLEGEVVDFEGEHYQTKRAQLLPKGPRAAGPPILIGVLMGGPRMQRLVAQFAQIWNCWLVDRSDVNVYLQARDSILKACDKHGRDPDSLRKNVTIGVDVEFVESGSDEEIRIRGSRDEIADGLRRFVEADVDHLSVSVRPFSDESIAKLADIVRELR